MYKKFIIVLVTIVVVLGFYFLYSRNKEQLPSTPPSQLKEGLYTNVQYGYGIVFPSDVTYVVGNSSAATFNVNSQQLTVRPDATDCSHNYTGTTQPKNLIGVGDTIINGAPFSIETYQFQLNSAVTETDKNYFTLYKNRCYSIDEKIKSVPGANIDSTIVQLDKIVQTFRFTK